MGWDTGSFTVRNRGHSIYFTLMLPIFIMLRQNTHCIHKYDRLMTSTHKWMYLTRIATSQQPSYNEVHAVQKDKSILQQSGKKKKRPFPFVGVSFWTNPPLSTTCCELRSDTKVPVWVNVCSHFQLHRSRASDTTCWNYTPARSGDKKNNTNKRCPMASAAHHAAAAS